MEQETYISPIANAVSGLPAVERWREAALTAQQAANHASEVADYQPTNMDSTEQVGAHVLFLRERGAEEDARSDLMNEIVDPNWDGLDVLGKNALVHSLGQFSVERRPYADNDGWLTLPNVARMNETPKLALDRDEAPVPGAEAVFWQADQIHGALATIDGLVGDGSRVIVDEVDHWTELRGGTTRRPAHDTTFRATIRTEAVVQDRDSAFPVQAPYYDEETGTVVSVIPFELAKLKVSSMTGRSSRASESIGYERTRSGMRFGTSDAGEYTVNVPLVPVQYAAGDDVSSLVVGPADWRRTGHTMKMKIDGTKVPMPQLESPYMTTQVRR